MKKSFLALLPVLVIGLFVNVNCQNSKDATIKEFVKGISAFDNEKFSAHEPIKSFNDAAKKIAAKTLSVTKSNITTILLEAKNYKHAIITVGNHTIVKISDFEKCSPSTAWSVCMPKGEGYIQKGGMESKSDFINNIIGSPDSQTRTIYFFN